MYVRTVIAHPALGSSAELEAVTRDIVKAQQAAGARVALSVRAFSGTQAFVARTVVPDMAGVAALRAQAGSPEARGVVAKVEPLLREPLTVNLYEVLLPVPGNVSAATYALFARIYPALGKGPELRALLEAEATAEQADGIAVTLSRAAVSSEGPVFVAAYALADLPALEQLGQRLGADARWQAMMGQVAPLLLQPIQNVLEEVLLSFPS